MFTVGAELGTAELVGDGVVPSSSVGATVGRSVGLVLVGTSVGATVGSRVIGAKLGALVGDCVGESVSVLEGNSDGDPVGTFVIGD